MASVLDFVRSSAANALFWTGVLAIGLTLLRRDASFLLFAAGVLALNTLLFLVLRQLSPQAAEEVLEASGHRHTPAVGEGGMIGFSLTPLQYPKVVDRDSRDFVSEFIHFDISRDGSPIFSGNLGRDALKQLRDALDGALSAKQQAVRQIMGNRQGTASPQPAIPQAGKKSGKRR
ncbi:hypothetical protein HY995_02005 [Candidatus Micrarchaeota archaeon]|nr:hypothetical protein [Candidatus Micrarchaeota archaeon]MBI5176841.1 hypothetical protein [Candidatus Micrarchaeota archaeon]